MLNNKGLDNKGFTLIELLVALALLVILSGALYGTYFSVMAARDKAGARIEERRELATTLGRLRSELAAAFFRKDQDRLFMLVEDRDSFGKPASLLAFSTITPPRLDGARASDVTLVSYSVKENEGVLSLMRESRDRFLDKNWKSVRYPVMEAIEGFQVECWDGGKWVRSWDSAPTMNHTLPQQLRVTVTLKGGEQFSIIAAPKARGML